MTWKYLGIFVSIDHSITRRLRWHASALATRYKEQIPNPAVDLCKIPESITISETGPRRTRIMGTTLCPTAVLFEIAWLFSNFFWRSRRCDLFEHTFCDKRTNHLSFGDPQAPTKEEGGLCVARCWISHPRGMQFLRWQGIRVDVTLSARDRRNG